MPLFQGQAAGVEIQARSWLEDKRDPKFVTRELNTMGESKREGWSHLLCRYQAEKAVGRAGLQVNALWTKQTAQPEGWGQDGTVPTE